MSRQKHTIKKQVIELHVSGDLDGREIQRRTSQVFRELLLPLIDKALSENSAPGTKVRIDRLELDAGMIEISDWERRLVENTEAELHAKLPAALKKQEPAVLSKKHMQETETGSDLDMIAYFLQTGLVPWWAKETGRHGFEQALHTAVAQVPARLKGLLITLLQNETGLKRLVCACSDDTLYAVLQTYSHDAVATVRKLEPQYGFPPGRTGSVAAQLRQAWWKAVFTTAIDTKADSKNGFAERLANLLGQGPELFTSPAAAQTAAITAPAASSVSAGISRLVTALQNAGTHLAAHPPAAGRPDQATRQTLQALEAQIALLQMDLQEAEKDNLLFGAHKRPVFEKFLSHAKQAAAMLATLQTEKGGTQPISLQGKIQDAIALAELLNGSAFTAKENSGRREKLLDAMANSLHDLNGLFPANTVLLAGNPAAEKCIEQVNALKSMLKAVVEQKAFNRTPADASLRQLKEYLDEVENLLTASSSTAGEQQRDVRIRLNNMIASLKTAQEKLDRHHATLALRKAATATSLAYNKRLTPSKKLYDPFSETEKLYINNAGLVLLWPFLHRFFRNLELADDKAFADESAAEKACLLLQYLTGCAPGDMFEAQLPLNKILCGIEVSLPVDTQRAIEPDEAEAGDNLLSAVLQNGPLWKTLSLPAFRQAYLNREGLISTRDGNWLLQVKRETYDVIVDRLPWTIRIVKLPWMERLIFVEW